MSGCGQTYVIGGGLAGLACAVRLAEAGAPVTVLEAAGQAGGRCRSFFDETLGCTIDNGNHLLLSGNGAVFAYLATIGASDALTGPARAAIPFFDLGTGTRWTLKPGAPYWPWWLMPGRGVPGATCGSWLRLARLAGASADATVVDILDDGGVLYRRLWRPLTIAALNTEAEQASARLFAAMARETLLRGEAACRPRVARDGLSTTFVAPALEFLARHGVAVRFNHRVRSLAWTNGRVTAIQNAQAEIPISAEDTVVLATPPAVAADLVPGLVVPGESRTIVNVHFRLAKAVTGSPAILGLVGGTAEWVFVRGDIVSVTVSAADALAEQPAELIAARIWPEVNRALERPASGAEAVPPFRVIKERRATLAQTPAANALRPAADAGPKGLILAGDWTQTGLPATIEGAIRSGFRAAEAVLRQGAGLTARSETLQNPRLNNPDPR